MTKYIVFVEDVPDIAEVGFSARWKQLTRTFEANSAEAAAKLAQDGNDVAVALAVVPESSFPIFELETEVSKVVKATRRTPQRKRKPAAPSAPLEADAK